MMERHVICIRTCVYRYRHTHKHICICMCVMHTYVHIGVRNIVRYTERKCDDWNTLKCAFADEAEPS